MEQQDVTRSFRDLYFAGPEVRCDPDLSAASAVARCLLSPSAGLYDHQLNDPFGGLLDSRRNCSGER